MKGKFHAGTTSYIDRVYIQNSSTGEGLSGLAYNTANLVWWYGRIGASSLTQVTLADATLGTWTSGGFKEVDSVNWPGLYEIGVPNAVIAGGSPKAHMVLRGASSMLPCPVEYELDAVDYLDATSFGITRIDATIGSRSTFDPTATVPFRNQDDNVEPTYDDCFQGAWSYAFAAMGEAPPTNPFYFIVSLPTGLPAKTFALANNPNGLPYARS